MKVSEITVSDVANYLRLEPGEYTEVEIQTLIDAAKAFIKSYTGLDDISITNENIGTGDGIKTIFYLKNTPVVLGTQTIYVDGIAKTKDTDYYLDEATGKIVFVNAPPIGAAITATYKAGIDAYEDFTIVVYILCQDMYDNRSLYIDESNLNKVVDTILGMHCTNLLPTPDEDVI